MPLRYAVTGTDARMERLKELLLADGHTLCPPAEAEEIVPPPWDRQARYTRLESYQTANAALTADGALALLREELDLEGQAVLVTGFGRLGSLCALRLAGAGARVTVAARGELAGSGPPPWGFPPWTRRSWPAGWAPLPRWSIRSPPCWSWSRCCGSWAGTRSCWNWLPSPGASTPPAPGSWACATSGLPACRVNMTRTRAAG